MPNFSDEIKKLLQGTPFGEVYPPRPNPDPPPLDGRTVALRILRKYISELEFFRTAEDGEEPIKFQIPPRDIHIEWPDSEEDLRFPAIAFLSTGPAEYAVIGLTGYVEEDTRDLYKPGTVVQWMSEYTETFTIEIHTTKRAERRAVLSGLEIALTPTEQMYGLRFKMPDYFNELVCFTVQSRELIDDGDALKNRRRARIAIEMRHNVVALVNYNTLQVAVKTEVDVDEDTNIPVVLDDMSEPPNRHTVLAEEAGLMPGSLPRDPCDDF